LSQERHIEVNQQAYTLVSEFQVGQELGLVNRHQFLNGFQFQNDFVLHEEIDLVATVQLQTFIFDRQVHLSLEAQPAKMKLVAQALFVCRFQKTGAKMTMDLDGPHQE